MEIGTLLLVLHIFGVVFGAGGAFVSDGMFFISIKDKILTKTEIGFMKLGSRFVWLGLGLLILSGIGLFLLDPITYSTSAKFQIKMFIVLIIALNGIYFHISHIPFLEKRHSRSFNEFPELVAKRNYLIISGVVSLVSWSLAIILGALRSIPITFTQALAAYVLLIIIGSTVAYLGRDRFIPLK